jgi:hypothetical protein
MVLLTPSFVKWYFVQNIYAQTVLFRLSDHHERLQG